MHQSHKAENIFTGYQIEPAYRNSPDWIVSGLDSEGSETALLQVNSEGVARSHLYRITGDHGWLVQTGKKERRLLTSPSVMQILRLEMDKACDSLVVARQGMKDRPDDLEWPGIEEGTIDGLRSLMRIAQAAGLDTAHYEAIIKGDA